jgi:hypothetical protein
MQRFYSKLNLAAYQFLLQIAMLSSIQAKVAIFIIHLIF